MNQLLRLHLMNGLFFLLTLPFHVHAACIPLVQKDPNLPIKITKAGYYCLIKDLVYRFFTNCAIEVKANHVVVDLQGHTLIGAPAEKPVGPTIGGVCSYERRYITVKNGAIRGFDSGVNLSISGNKPSYTTGHLVENLHTISVGSGIGVDGNDNIIRNNRIYPGGGGISLSAYGKRNIVSGNMLFSNASISVGDNAIIENNRLMRGAIGGQMNITLLGNVLGNNGVIAITSGVLRDNILVNPEGTGYQFSKPSLIIDGGGNIPALP